MQNFSTTRIANARSNRAYRCFPAWSITTSSVRNSSARAVIGIAVEVARAVGADVTHVERAARLAKADLRTEMVGEFSRTAGNHGRYYALHDGETVDVADAIAEHYKPRFATDELPASVVGICVALADKLEALVGLFGIGERPTGDKDSVRAQAPCDRDPAHPDRKAGAAGADTFVRHRERRARVQDHD